MRSSVLNAISIDSQSMEAYSIPPSTNTFSALISPFLTFIGGSPVFNESLQPDTKL